jgi:hypothetical protein
MQHFFGTGAMVATSTASGTQTPRKMAALQDISAEFSFNIKELHGSKAFPIAIGRGMGKISCKAKYASLDARALGDLIFTPTATPTTTQRILVEDEVGTTGTAAYTAANVTGFEDLGAINASTGEAFTKIATGGTPAAGEYKVSSVGVYTFVSGFTGDVMVTYSYTATISNKSKLIIDNQVMGAAPYFTAVLAGKFNQVGSGGTTTQKDWYLKLYACVASKWSIQTKQEDFMIPEFDFSAFAGADGNIAELSFEE